MRLTAGRATLVLAGGGVRVGASAAPVGDADALGRTTSTAARLGGINQSSSSPVGVGVPSGAAARAGGGLALS